MPNKQRTYEDWDKRCNVLSRAYGQISIVRNDVRQVGAKPAADAISRSLKSLDGAIRHAQRMRTAAEVD